MNRPAKSDQELAKAIQLHQSGDLDRAIRLYEKVVRKQPRHAAALNLLGLANFQAGRAEDAVAPMERALAIKPDLPDARYNLGLILHSLRRFEGAIPHLQQSVAERPNDAEAHNNLGAALKEFGRYEEAAEQYRAALALDPSYAEAHCNLGLALLALDRAQEAEVTFRRALELRPLFAEANIGLGNAMIANDRAEEALALFERAISIKPGNVEAYLGLGIALTALERNEEAFAQFRKAISLQPDHLEAIIRLGFALQSAERHDEASVYFNRALELEPENNPDIYILRGRVLHELERYDEGIADFDRAIALNPASSAAYEQKGETLVHLGQFEEARICLEKAIEMEPCRISSYHSLAYITNFELGDEHIERLERLAKDLHGLSPKERLYLHATLGKACSDIGQFERAIPHFVEAGQIRRSTLPYDEEKTLRLKSRIREVFDPDLLHDKRGAGTLSNALIAVVGMPRSGKTWVGQMLGSHPKVFSAGELSDFAALVRNLEEKTSKLFPDMAPDMTNDALREFGNEYIRRVGAAAGDLERIVDEMPGNFHFLGLIHLSQPNARIVHMMRDPVDQCMACFAKLFSTGHAYSYDLGELGRYYRAYRALMEHWRRVLPEGTMIDVQYESMVEDFEGQARRIVAHCGLEWDDACLSFYKTERPVITRNGRQVRQPIRNEPTGQWREYRAQLRPLFDALEID